MTGQAWRAIIVAVLTTALGACGGDDDNGGGVGSELEGIYQATEWTRNDTACDTPGPSVLATESQTVFYIKNEAFIQTTLVNVNFCADQAECETVAADDSTINLGRWVFDEGSDAQGWTARSFFGTLDMNGMCVGTFTSAALTGATGQSARIVATDFTASGFPPDSDGFCDIEAATAAAQGTPCIAQEVVDANLIAPLP